MLTILNAIELSADYLQKKGVDSARINAELILADILNCKRMDLYLKFDQPLSEEETNNYREFIKRRGQREPLQYITGSVEFYGLNFIVNDNVLIPRPETELLVEEIINNFTKEEELRILDVGAGSGNISISLAKHLPNCKIISIDKSKNAIEVANKNALNNNINGQIDFREIDFNNFPKGEFRQFNIIVSNPPYITLQEYSSLEAELINYEPKEALTDFNDGLTFYKSITEKSKDMLQKKGKLFFEIGHGQSAEIRKIMEMNNFTNIKIIKDYQNIDRVIYGELE